jgi:hypothetical protein
MGVWREGVTVGLLGAAGVALWFFVVDLVAGQPLHTPGVLGHAVMAILNSGVEHSQFFNVAAYTAVHVAAFCLVGIAACAIVDIAHDVPHVTVGLLLFFVVFEVGFYFIAMILSQYDSLAAIAWYQIGAANLVAAALMGGYIWRRHPELSTELKLALEGRV